MVLLVSSRPVGLSLDRVIETRQLDETKLFFNYWTTACLSSIKLLENTYRFRLQTAFFHWFLSRVIMRTLLDTVRMIVNIYGRHFYILYIYLEIPRCMLFKAFTCSNQTIQLIFCMLKWFSCTPFTIFEYNPFTDCTIIYN